MANNSMMPAAIVHEGKPSRIYAMDTVHMAARNLYLTWEVERVMLYYSQCANGFRPSRELIAKEAHVPFAHVLSDRKVLMEMGFISYNPTANTVKVNWDRIKLYATLDKRLTKAKKKENIYIAECNDHDQESKTIKELNKDLKEHIHRDLTPNQQHFYDAVDKMTVSEWNALNVGIGAYIPPAVSTKDDFSVAAFYAGLNKDFNPYSDISEMPWSGRLPIVETYQLPF